MITVAVGVLAFADLFYLLRWCWWAAGAVGVVDVSEVVICRGWRLVVADCHKCYCKLDCIQCYLQAWLLPIMFVFLVGVVVVVVVAAAGVVVVVVVVTFSSSSSCSCSCLGSRCCCGGGGGFGCGGCGCGGCGGDGGGASYWQ